MRAALPAGLGMLLAAATVASSNGGKGLEIYQLGTSGGRSVHTSTSRGSTALPAEALACVNCHGRMGEGLAEGGLLSASLRTVTSERDFQRAVVLGVDRHGAALNPSMPRYRMTPEELQQLKRYIDRLATGGDRTGVQDDSVTIGFATGGDQRLLPLVGHLLQAEADRINEAGGIYGRRLILRTAVHSAELQRAAFLLVASLDDAPSPPVLPSIGPLRMGQASSGAFTVLATQRDQLEALCRFLEQQKRRHVLMLHPQQGELAATLQTLLARHGMQEASLKQSPDAAVYLGPPGALLASMRDVPAKLPVFTLLSCSGKRAFALAPELQARLRIVDPALTADEFDASALPASFQTVAGASVALPVLTAARVVEEALRRTGRDLTRERFVQSLESLKGFSTGLTYPVTFGPNRHAGVRGASLVGVEQSTYIPLAAWVNLED